MEGYNNTDIKWENVTDPIYIDINTNIILPLSHIKTCKEEEKLLWQNSQ